jgi:hypothetical protein
LVIGQLRQASEGVKEKLLCGHLLLCQHLLSCSYSISPIVRPSTKVSLICHKTHSQGSSPKGTQSQDSFTGFLSKGNSFTRIIHRVPFQRELIHKNHSQGYSSKGTHSQDSFTGFLFTTVHVLHSFYTCSSEKNKKNSSHSIMELSSGFMFSSLHDLTINQ